MHLKIDRVLLEMYSEYFILRLYVQQVYMPSSIWLTTKWMDPVTTWQATHSSCNHAVNQREMSVRSFGLEKPGNVPAHSTCMLRGQVGLCSAGYKRSAGLATPRELRFSTCV
jgi:hypothetical protein